MTNLFKLMEDGNTEDLGFSSPAFYQIKIKGTLHPRWLNQFGDLTLDVAHRVGCHSFSIIRGEISDQAQLIGILNSLHKLHLPVVEVRWLSVKSVQYEG
jgi:hypothetical protein